jgi:hypothetical protein
MEAREVLAFPLLLYMSVSINVSMNRTHYLPFRYVRISRTAIERAGLKTAESKKAEEKS